MSNNLIFFLLKLKNAAVFKNESILIIYKKEYLFILTLLYKEGFIQTYNIFHCQNQVYILIYLRYLNNIFALKNLKLISKPSKIINIKYKHLMNTYTINKTLIISTSQGLKTQFDCKKFKLGGKLFFTC